MDRSKAIPNLQEIYEEDLEDRSSNKLHHLTQKKQHLLKQRDKKRKKLVLSLYKSGLILSALDFHHASLILQHGDSVEEFSLAHQFAKKALELGDESSKWLCAATEDRYLLSIGKAQKYGTQFLNNKNGQWELAKPIDPNVTDEERAKYNVPPIAEALEKYKEKYDLD